VGRIIAEIQRKRKTYVKELCIVENLTVFEVVPLGITEALFEVVFDCD
jgi:hypothetical protein